jgi:cation:H+ antiporter
VHVGLAFVFAVAGFILLWKGADWLVEGASRLALLAKLSPIIIGITIVAFGTSLPEVSVSLAATIKGEPSITVGNVIGSNIANILLVLGIAAVVKPLKLTRELVTRDSMLVAGSGAVILILAMTGTLRWWHGAIMLIGFVAYLGHYIHDALVKQKADLPPFHDTHTGVAILLVIAGIICILFGSDILVESAVVIAEAFGISKAVIGLTLIAIGTSLPELATSTVASKKGEADISIGNVLGSNVFNGFLVLGLATLLVVEGIAIETEMLWDILFMTLVCLVLVPTLKTGLTLTRTEGIFMLIMYAVYIGSMAYRQGLV